MPTATAEQRVCRDLTVRSFEVRSESWDEATRSFEAVLATEAPVLVMDLDRWEPVEEVLLARGCKLPKNRQVPLLDSHNRTSVREGQVGSVREIKIENGQVSGRNFISSVEPGIATKVKEGHVTDCSVGYRVVNSVTIEPGQTAEVNGQSYTAGPTRALRVTVEWQLKENSLCPIGADEDAKVREEPAGQVQRLPAQQKEGIRMPEPNAPAPAGAPAAPPAAPAPAPVVPAAPEPQSRVEVAEEVLQRRVLAITPHELVGVAQQALLEGKDFEGCRAAVLEAFARGKRTPVGSTEPEQPAPGGQPAGHKIADVSGETLVRSLLG
jgi:hypothetical protein